MQTYARGDHQVLTRRTGGGFIVAEARLRVYQRAFVYEDAKSAAFSQPRLSASCGTGSTHGALAVVYPYQYSPDEAGYQLAQVQRGRQPADFKPMPSFGPGVEELRIWSDRRTFRVVYIARLPESVYVLHAFQKTSASTSRPDIAKARHRYMELKRARR